jgi:hypothetical protein
MRSTLLFIACLAAQFAAAQTYFYINSMAVLPEEPTTQDPVNLHINGGLSSSGAYIVGVQVEIVEQVIHVTIDAADPGGLAIIVDHTEIVELGMLPAGTYTVHIMGDHVLDLTPEEFEFTVTGGGGGSLCDSLMIISIRYHGLSDSLIEVHVINAGATFFNYPGFILLDQTGDTIAMEQVNAFGLMEYHQLVIHPDADLTLPVFNGTLQLWTGFYDELACSIPVQVDLCPPPDCAIIIPYVMNLGGAMTIGTFQYEIHGLGGLVTAGEIVLDAENQFSSDTICLPPGNYTMYTTGDATAGQPWAGVTTMGSFGGPQVPVQGVSPFPPTPLEFTFYEQCIPITESVVDATADEFILLQSRDELMISARSGEILSGAWLFNANGAVIGTASAPGHVQRFPLSGLASGVYLVRIHSADGKPHSLKFVVGN